MAIPPLILHIVAESSGVKAGVASANAQISGLKQSITKNAGAIKMALGTAVVAGFAVAIKAASDLGEAQNKANVIFGDSVGIVNKLAETSASAFGISEAAALSAAGGFGAMFDAAGLAEGASAQMSTTMVKLAADMASFNNEDPSAMLERLRAGLAGEAEPLRRFGAFISEARVKTEAYESGIATLGAELTDAQKIQARFNIIMKDTAKQQGDFARTLGTSLPNQIRKLQAELTDLAADIGKDLLPVATDLVRVIGDLARVVGPILSSAVKAAVATMGPFRDVLGEVNEILGGDLGPSTQDVGQRLGILGDIAGFLNPQLKTSVDIIKQGTEAYHEHASSVDDDTKALKGQVNILGGVESVLGSVGGSFVDFAGTTQESLDAVRDEIQETFEVADDIFTQLQDKANLTAREVLKAFEKQIKVQQDYQRNFQELVDRDLPGDLLLELSEMGLGGANIVAALADANSRQFKQIVRVWEKSGGNAADLAAMIAGIGTAVNNLPDAHTITISVNAVVSGVESVADDILDAILGSRAAGGPVTGMRPYIVGERGPELFVPNTSGTIVPNDRLDTGAGNVYLTINTIGDPEQIGNAASRHIARMLARQTQ